MSLRQILALALPFVYIPLFIFGPIVLLNTNYGWSVMVLFWIPALALYVAMAGRMPAVYRKAFWLTFLVMAPVTIVFEYLCLYLDIWNFSEAKQKLCGMWIGPAPIEEFVFWFGATPLCLMVYLWFRLTVFKPAEARG